MKLEEKIENIEFKPRDFIPLYGLFTNISQFNEKGWKNSLSNNIKVATFIVYQSASISIVYNLTNYLLKN